MAVIGSVFNPERAEQSQSYAYKCWYDYNYRNNSMRIPADEMQNITQNWKSEISNWRANAEQDDNAYEIEDDDWSAAKLLGSEKAEEASGHNGNRTGSNTKSAAGAAVNAATIGVSAAGLAGATALSAANIGAQFGANAAAIAGSQAGMQAMISTTANASSKAMLSGASASEALSKGAAEGAKAAADASKEASQQALEKTNTAWMISCPLSLAVGTLYMATKPNKKEHDALMQLKNIMQGESQPELLAIQAELEALGGEILETSEEATEKNEEYNEELEEKQEQYEVCMEAYTEIMERVKSGEPISEEDRALLEEIGITLKELGEEIAELQEDSVESNEETYEGMEERQAEYDERAERIANVQATTDLAASFDSQTKTMAIIESVSQGLNAASGTIGAVQAGIAVAASLGMNAYAWACVGMGTAGAAMSGVGVVQQAKFAADIGDEINVRQETEDLTAQTLEAYGQSLDNYDQYLTDVNDLEFELPEELEGLEDFEVPETPETPEEPESPETPEASETPGTPNPQEKNNTATGNEPSYQPANASPIGTQAGQTRTLGLFGNLQKGDEDKKNPFI